MSRRKYRFCEPKAIYSTYKWIKRNKGLEEAKKYLKRRMS